jgi:chemotaxis protein histidine kinase CheA
MINMKCPICGKDLDLQNKQIGTSENGDPIFNEYAICHSCKKQWNLDKQRAKKIAAKKAAEEKAKAEAAARAAEEKAKAEAAARAAEEKAKAEAAARAAEEKAKADAAARAAEEKRAARREAKARARKEAIARLAADKGISEEEAERILKERARARKAAAQKAATDATATDNSEEQKYGNIPAEEIRDKREKAVRKGYEDMLATDPDSKAAKKKKKEEAETAKAKEDVKSRKMDDYDDEDDDEYEYVDEYPRFRPGRIILGIISLLAFGFCIYKGFVTGLSTSGADVTSASGMNYVIVALCMLVTALLYFIMNNRDTLFAFLIPMILYIGCAVFAFLKHGDEFELLILAGVSGVLAVISLILAIASRGGDDYDDEDDYDDPFEEEHDN